MISIYKKAILPIGFKANAVSCGIKRSGKLDLALFYSDFPSKAVGQFTTNKIQAAPIKIDKAHLKKNIFFRAIIVNSGNANSFTGREGLKDALETTQFLAKHLKLKKEEVLVASTGIIGKRLPLIKIKRAIPKLVKGLSL
ncbi:MAG: bifunctional ornithine acetyltransferase/N-acetylglutamate synthase, partial [Candidatus Omnitrophica bacterium]|nr:bifunctional ornithine acetyltransferase/N-acetylglutamate synthase [Candidatus Omnitrophota bacterium]